jgi:hypothetical protein
MKALVIVALLLAACAPEVTPGPIVFGTSIPQGAYAVSSPLTSFHRGTAIGWVATMSEPFNATTLTLSITSEVVNSVVNMKVYTVPVTNPQDDAIAHPPDDVLQYLQPGTYTVTYIRTSDGTELATGTVVITP